MKPGKPLSRKTPLRARKRTLRQSRSTKRPTEAESERMGRLKRMDCIACTINRERGFYDHCHWWHESDAHHLLSGGRRIGHSATIPLCPFHHRGIAPVEGMGTEAAIAVYGPNLERQKAFRDYYGTDDELLAMVNEILENNP